jgi:hypothetical protein
VSDIERRNDIAADMLERLPAQFRDKPRIEAIVRALANQIQKHEQTFYDLWFRRMLDNAEDVDLDNIGAIVGEERQGWGDDEYRQYIRARIKTNRSDGRTETLIAILVLLFELDAADVGNIRIREYYPATMVVETFFRVTADGEYINRGFLQRAKPAAVNLDYVAWPATYVNTFIADDSVTPFVDGTTQGAADDGGGVTGGIVPSRYGA